MDIERADIYTGEELAKAAATGSGGVFEDADGNEYTVAAKGSKLIFKTDAGADMKANGTVVPRLWGGPQSGLSIKRRRTGFRLRRLLFRAI